MSHRISSIVRSTSLGLATAAVLAACASSNLTESPMREHDTRIFVADAHGFDAINGASAYFGLYDGLQGPAVYAAEIPANWSGQGLVLYTHGYRGTGDALPTSIPPEPWRDAVLSAGYAWAASSYSANYYDIRAGIEDTNKLALQLTDYLLRDWNITYPDPQQYLVSGMSLGGHIAAATVERENMARTLYPVPYSGAAPMCQAEQNQFQWLGDYTKLVQTLAGYGYMPDSAFQSLLGEIDPRTRSFTTLGPLLPNLFIIDPSNGQPTWEPANLNGERLMAMAMNLTGGERPIFEHGFKSIYQNIVLATGGSDGTMTGILDRNLYDNTDRVYRWSTGPTPTEEELAFNAGMTRTQASRGANDRRRDGVRWLPEVHGDFAVPVLTMHTLGDFYVPFRHEQLYREGALRNGNADLLVQRAIRAPAHCDFSPNEIKSAVSDWLVWVNGGAKPAGDIVLEPEVVAAANYGCAFTTPDREGLPACSKP
jgi:hypothetical protein